jgi:hypothetical protein
MRLSISLLFLFAFASTNLLAIKIVPPLSKNLLCINSKTNKTIYIKSYNKITIWHNTELGIIKTSGMLIFVDDSTVHIKKNGSIKTIKIPIHTIQAISQRNATKIIASTLAFTLTSTLSVFIIKLLHNVNKSNNSSTPSYGNGMAGVIGIVMGIIAFPSTIISSIIWTKQLSHKKMQLTEGWKFEAK